MKNTYLECESLYLRALDIRRNFLGNASHETAATLNNLGNLHRLKGNYCEAERYFIESLTIRERYYKEDNDRVAQSLVNLGNVLMKQVVNIPNVSHDAKWFCLGKICGC